MQANGEGTKVALSMAVPIDMNLPASVDTRGKHRILAELKHLEQEARFLEEELEELEKTEKVSAVVQELLRKIESNAEPLLPITHGPVNPSWDRWFEGPPDSRHFGGRARLGTPRTEFDSSPGRRRLCVMVGKVSGGPTRVGDECGARPLWD